MFKKPLNLLKNIIPEDSDDFKIKVEYNESNTFFSFKNINLICRLIDGKYPNYDAVIPKENPNKLNVDRAAFLNCIKRVSIFANKTTHQVELHVSAEDLDFANEANERITCSYEGEDIEIGFNSRFLIEMLANLDTEDVQLEMSAPNKAGILSEAKVFSVSKSNLAGTAMLPSSFDSMSSEHETVVSRSDADTNREFLLTSKRKSSRIGSVLLEFNTPPILWSCLDNSELDTINFIYELIRS